jgi:predicted dehydrogenase
VKFGHGGTFVICRDAVVTIDPKVEIHTADGVREVTRDDTGHEGRIRQYRNLISAIEDGTPLFASELEGLRTIEILDAAERSRASGRREPVHLHN